MKQTFNHFFPLLFLSILISSCANIRNAQKITHDKSYCIQQADFNYTYEDLPKPYYSLTVDTVLTNHLSVQTLNTANAIGILGLLTDYAKAINDYRQNPSMEKKIDIMYLSQRINRKIDISSLEISAVASELDCEEERADQFAYFLKEKEGTIEKRLVIGSIIVGALGTVTTEALANSNHGAAASAVAIGSSAIEATFGVLMLTNKKKVDFFHPINPLTDIWNIPKVSKYYPPSIWYYLTYKDTTKQNNTLVQLLKDKWLVFGQIADKRDKNKDATYELYFGKGGKYTSEQLKNRADMLDQIEAYITLMKQNLRALSTEIELLTE